MNPDTKILIVDDDEDSLQAFDAILCDLNHITMRAKTGAEAMRLVLLHEFAVILLDVKLPDMDGFQIAEFMRKNLLSKRTPIIFITAYGNDETMILRGYAIGAVDYIFKPVIPYVLHSKISVFIDLFEMAQQIKEQKRLLEQQSQLELHKRAIELQEMNKKLEASNCELEQFADIASHDLREPLRTITNFIQLFALRHEATLDADSRKYLFFIVDGAERMKILINTLLEISQVGRKDLVLENTSVARVLDRVKFNLEIEIRETLGTVTLHNNCDVMVSPMLFQQLLQNLVGNALKFRGKNPIEIDIYTEKQEAHWLFSIWDNGIGINPELRNQIFQIFQKLHKPSEYPGTGIGLAICEKIVRKHGGKIWVESAGESGSVFFFTIPI